MPSSPVLINMRPVVRVQLVLVQQRVQLLESFPPCRQSSVCSCPTGHGRTTGPALVDLIRAICERVSAVIAPARRDPEDPLLKVVPRGTWRSIVWRGIVLHVDGDHHAPLCPRCSRRLHHVVALPESRNLTSRSTRRPRPERRQGAPLLPIARLGLL